MVSLILATGNSGLWMRAGEGFLVKGRGMTGRGCDLLARKDSLMPKCTSVEIEIQTHSNCMSTKLLNILPNETGINSDTVIFETVYTLCPPSTFF